MSPLLSGLAGAVVFEMSRHRVPRPGLVAGIAAAILWQPRLAVPVAVAGVLLVWRRRLGARRRTKRAIEADVPVLIELVGIGLSAGLPLVAALEAAAEEVHPALEAEVRGVLRRARRAGIGTALQEATGAGEDLYRIAARAGVTGAPLLPAVAALVVECRHTERTEREAKARRLPVRLLLPLALLILPGFVVLTVGPTFLSAIERLKT